jgi:4-amino-4-deoxy-L-arabinose transferase-like glycosyltransferase
MTERRALLYLALLLLLKGSAALLFINYGNVGLGPDEAQYWTWSQEPALGYYSKPPGIAWQIWLGTKLFGNSELGVRFGALLIGTLLPLTLFFLARKSGMSPLASLSAGIAMALCPLGWMASLLAITDGGQVLFWTLATLLVASAIARQQAPSYAALGLCILAGALFKWPIYLFWLFAIGSLYAYRGFSGWRLVGGMALSLLGLLPSLIWNYQHSWVTFRHVVATIEHGATSSAHVEAGNFFDFLGAQIALLSPILFGLYLVGIWALVRRSAAVPPAVAFCGWSSLLIILGYASLALFKKMQGNWCDFAYPGALVLTAWVACDYLTKGVRWMVGGIALGLALALFTFAIPLLQERSLAPLPYAINPFRHNVGWHSLGQELKKAGYDPSQHFLFGDKYQTSSILSFYAEGKKRAYFLNIGHVRKNQFTFWPSMAEEQRGRTGYFVLTENVPTLTRQRDTLAASYQRKLSDYFDQVEFLGLRPLFLSNGQIAKGALIFRCVGYNGREPVTPALY